MPQKSVTQASLISTISSAKMVSTNVTTSGATNDTLYLSLWAVEPYHEAVAVPCVFGLIFIIGVIGNGTLMFIVARNKVMRNVPNLLIVSLSLGDLLLILISVPLTSTVYTFSSWPFGALACKVNHFLQTWSLGVTVFILTALSVDRYWAISDPLSKHKGKSQTRTVMVSLSIWVLAFVLALPDAILSTESTRLHHPPYHIRICSSFPDRLVSEDQLVPKVYFALRFVVFFAVPVVVIAWFYLMMAKTLVRSGKKMPCEGKIGSLNQQRQTAARKKVARIVLSFVIIFVLCWLPRHVYLLWFFFDDSYYNEFWHYFKILGFCLTYLNSCVNPFALYFLSSQFRKYYKHYLLGCFKKMMYSRMEQSSAMHNLNSTQWKASPTDTSVLNTQSAF